MEWRKNVRCDTLSCAEEKRLFGVNTSDDRVESGGLDCTEYKVVGETRTKGHEVDEAMRKNELIT